MTLDLRCDPCQEGNHPHRKHGCDCPCTDAPNF